MDFVERLREVSDAVLNNKQYAKKEASTKSYLIDPFISELGYKRNNPDDVEPEFAADTYASKTPVDYALKKDGNYIIFVECKPAKTPLSHENTIQLQHYFSTKLDVRFGILTNGLEYRFYSDLEKPNVMDDEPFLTLNLLELDDNLLRELERFTKECFELDQCLVAARKLKYRQKIKDAISQTFDPLSENMVKLIVKKVYSGFYTKVVRDEYAPLVLETWQEFLTSKRTSFDRSFVTISESTKNQLQNGVVEVPVYGTYKDKRFEATLLFNTESRAGDLSSVIKSKVRIDGKIKSLSRSSLDSVRSINPKIKAWNGWTWWKLRDPLDNIERYVKDLLHDSALRGRVLRKHNS